MHVQPGSLLLEAALRYAELGYPVFPCAPGTKRPLTKNGFLDATTDAGQVERWWSARPNANIAVATQGLLVVDVDSSDNPWLADDPEKQVELASGALSLTANGGRHYVFRQPEERNWRGTSGALAERVDTRADGGYIVVPPSVLQGGKAYRWAPSLELDVPPASLPEPPAWLAAELDRLAARGPSLARVAAGDASANKIPSGQRNATLARLGGAMRRVGMSQAEILAALVRANADRCDPPLDRREVERIAASVARYEPDQVSVAIAEDHWAQMYEEPATEPADQPADPGSMPEHLLDVPGFVGEVMRYTLDTAPYPVPILAFGAALALQALLTGRKVRDPGDSRTNIYILGLANSGAGKDHPRKVNQRILLEAGMSDCLGDTFASGEGIEDRLFVHPAVLFQTDEIDGLMTKINQAKDARHEGIMNVLLKMYTSASALYPMRVKAGKDHGVIDQPCLCVFGTAIPKHYYEALSLKMLTNGFFARMLVLESGKRGKGQDAVVRDLPSSVRETARWWSEFCPGERRRGNLLNWHPVPRVVEYSTAAESMLRTFRERADDEYSKAEDKGDPAAMAIWARANEKARRLALIYACSENHEEPLIGESAAHWASEFVDHQTRRMLFMAAEHVSENEFHARCKRLISVLRDWKSKKGDEWMPFWRLNRKLPWSEREHEEVRTTLINQKAIQYDERRTGGPTQKLYRLP